MNLILKTLDFQKCFNYLQEEYSSGLFFSERLVQEPYLKKGRFYTVVPSYAKEEHLYEFQWGGRIYPFYRPPGVTIMKVRNDSKEMVNSSLLEYVKQSNTHFIGMEDFSADPDSSNVNNSNWHYHLLKTGKLLYLLDQNFSSDNFFRHYAKAADRYLSLCLILKLPPGFMNSISSIKLDDQSTDQIFDGITSFFISVYDGEGYLIWCESEQNDFLKLIEAHLGY